MIIMGGKAEVGEMGGQRGWKLAGSPHGCPYSRRNAKMYFRGGYQTLPYIGSIGAAVLMAL